MTVALTLTSEKLLAEFDRAAISWGFQQASVESDALGGTELDYIEADAVLRKHISALERKVHSPRTASGRVELITYHPSCPACDALDAQTFYKSCQGCQTRRANAMKAFHAAPSVLLPAPSVDKPKTNPTGAA